METTDLTLRERKKIETKQRILEAAIQLFQARGFDQTSVDEIAAQASVSRATFFNYMNSKENVLHEIARNELQALKRLVEVELADQPSATIKIRRLMRQLVVDTLPYLHVTRYVLVRAMLYPSDETAISVHLGDLLAGLVHEAQAQGEIRADMPPTEIVHAILGSYLSLLLEQIAHSTPGQPHDTPAALTGMQRLFDMLLSGIAGPNTQA